MAAAGAAAGSRQQDEPARSEGVWVIGVAAAPHPPPKSPRDSALGPALTETYKKGDSGKRASA